MIEPSIMVGLLQMFFLIFGVMFIYTFTIQSINFWSLVKTIVFSICFALVGGIINDGLFLMVFGYMFFSEWVRQRTLKMDFGRLNILLLLISLQNLILSFSSAISKLILFNIMKSRSLVALSRAGTLFVIVEVGIVYTIALFLLEVSLKYIRKHPDVIIQVRQLKIDARIFVILFVLFFSIELLLMISDMEGVTAKIQMTLLFTFTLMVGLMGSQMGFIIRTYARQQALENEKLQNQQLNNYLKSIEQQYMALRRFKHDYRNLIISLTVKNEDQDIRSTDDYLTNLKKQAMPSVDLDDSQIVQVQNLGNEAVKGLIVQKFFDARKRGVKLNIEIMDKQFKVNQDLVTLVRIIGNLLDNAIDQAEKMVDKTVVIAFNEIGETAEISIENAIDNTFDVNKIFKPGYSSKGPNRGLGLDNVKDLIAKQNNLFLDIETPSNKVRMTLIMTKE
ncbi:histidine kinase [Lactobacillus sp. CBA3605]|uniref:sensor histidine kinase n=1 Tax=Lactobacillus sp. CBA3605 TaxID=2099788 RepID=UPI000CFCC7F1|nr:GHKL domain-containing protein [Lactobacillus sp. CBA3605]AVK61838.1 histidine kinase [Lactobacillus sp. CBA3605]